MKTIFLPLGKGRFTQVDSDCSAEILLSSWTANTAINGTVYAVRPKTKSAPRIPLHSLVCPPRPGEITDHKNGDSLDNHRENLRSCTPAQNQANRKKGRTPTSSQYKGVTWDKTSKKWLAQIRNPGKNSNRTLGRFKSEIEAAKAYDRAAKTVFGDFARPNFL